MCVVAGGLHFTCYIYSQLMIEMVSDSWEEVVSVGVVHIDLWAPGGCGTMLTDNNVFVCLPFLTINRFDETNG